METWSLVVLRDLEERFEMVGDDRGLAHRKGGMWQTTCWCWGAGWAA
jgi:hypothetical protein